MFTNSVIISARISKKPAIKIFTHEGIEKYLLSFDIAIKQTDRKKEDFFMPCVVFGSEKRLTYYMELLKCGVRYIIQGTLFGNTYEKTVAEQTIRIPQISINVFDIGFADKIPVDEENVLNQLNESASYGRSELDAG